ncbi:hypothetical protein E8E15_005011 [Penicillium rubens]|nr:hypothetical protein E8E15_005011 [Penicillium rubens]
MAENLANSDNNPNKDLSRAYEAWSDAGWGMIMTGNVQIDINHLGSFSDPAVQTQYTGPNDKNLKSWREYAEACQKHDSGFSGVELHAAHGYLLDQFLSPKSNFRTDAYGGSAEKRAKIVLDILGGCREVVPANFCIGLKLNSADHSAASFEDIMAQIGMFANAGIDFLEISGGTYENPRMVDGDKPAVSQTKSARTAAREAFFLDFAKETRKRYPNLVLMLTGGFRSRAGAEAAIKENACDIVGIARPAAINPRLPELFLGENIAEEDTQITLNKVRPGWLPKLLRSQVLGAGAETTHYGNQIHRLAKGLPTYAPDL